MKKNIYKKIEKFLAQALSIALVIALIGSYGHIDQIFADDPTPTDTSTPAPTQTTVDNSATTDTTVTTTANTGDNTVGSSPTPTVSPTPDVLTTPADSPTDTPTVTPDPSTGATPDPTPDATDSATTIDNTATVNNDSISSANTGDNTVTTTSNSDPAPETNNTNTSSTSSPSPTPTPAVTVMTGTAVALTNVNNDVNSTSVNSNVIAQTINIYVDQNASLDLSDPATFIKNIITNDPTDPTINLHITNVTNQASITNTVNSTANTGTNSVNTEGGAGVTTGDAISLVSVLNRVNLVAIDSVVHVVTINIFGTLNGDIILPLPPATTASDPCPQCSDNTTVTNTATVNNSVNSGANTGDNSVTATTNGAINTGDATSEVSINNLVNTVLIGDSVFSLYITPVGTWNGNFVGYQSVDPNSLDTMLIQDTNGQTISESATNLTSTNSATVTNVITSLANTGGNTVTAGSGTITTGNAVSAVSLINLVNTVLYRTTAFFGFINVFGTWNGNVGDAASLAKAESTPAPDPPTTQASSQSTTSDSSVQDSGGLLAVTNSNNVGAYVNPGDTVTFFVTVKNPGIGHVYNASLYLHLLKDGVDAGGQTFTLGTIDPGHGFKVTTGFVLSKATPGGLYIARADVSGTTGPNNDGVSASADSTFTVSGSVLGASSDNGSGGMVVSGSVPTKVQVLGTTTRAGTDNANILLALLVLLLLVPQYIFYRATRNRKLLSFVFANNVNWQVRFRAVQTFLL